MVEITQAKLDSATFRLTFPDVLKELRERGKYTQKELAHKLGLSYQAIQHWESGKSIPQLDQIPTLARALRVPLKQFLAKIYADFNP